MSVDILYEVGNGFISLQQRQCDTSLVMIEIISLNKLQCFCVNALSCMNAIHKFKRNHIIIIAITPHCYMEQSEVTFFYIIRIS